MKAYLRNIIPQLRNYSLSLNKKAILIDKPWALIDEDMQIQKLIFKSNNDLILSKNGHAMIGKWDYFAEAKSLLIDRVTDKILCNEAFINDGIIILKQDGSDLKFFILVNELIVPDLDALGYLRKLRNKLLNIFDIPLHNGQMLEVARNVWSEEDIPQVGSIVSIDGTPVADGLYKLQKDGKYFEVKNSRISGFIVKRKYSTVGGTQLWIHQKNPFKIKIGDKLLIDGERPNNGIFFLSNKKKIFVRNGRISEIKVKIPILGWLSV